MPSSLGRAGTHLLLGLASSWFLPARDFLWSPCNIPSKSIQSSFKVNSSPWFYTKPPVERAPTFSHSRSIISEPTHHTESWLALNQTHLHTPASSLLRCLSEPPFSVSAKEMLLKLGWSAPRFSDTRLSTFSDISAASDHHKPGCVQSSEQPKELQPPPNPSSYLPGQLNTQQERRDRKKRRGGAKGMDCKSDKEPCLWARMPWNHHSGFTREKSAVQTPVGAQRLTHSPQWSEEVQGCSLKGCRGKLRDGQSLNT